MAQKTVLIIDDDADLRASIRIVLEAAGFSVGEAGDGKEGLKIAEEVKPDAVIIDLMMETVDAVKNDDQADKRDFIRILLTKFDSRKKVSNDWVFGQLEPYQDMLFKIKIRQNEALNQAHMAQEPIFYFKPNSLGAEDYAGLTKELLALCHRSEKN